MRIRPKIWTVETMRKQAAASRNRFGAMFDRMVQIEPELLALEGMVQKVWIRLIREQPLRYSFTKDWYGAEGVKRALVKLVGWEVPTHAGNPPEPPEGEDGSAWALSEKYAQWHQVNEAALAELGDIASTDAYRACYEYLLGLMPLDRQPQEGEEEPDEDEEFNG